MPARQNRPVFNRLPVRGYQDNPVADALTSFYDSKLVSVGTQVEALHTKLVPETTDVGYLDWLAFMVGMVEPYYSLSWAPAVKRLAIRQAQTIFSNRGTYVGLDTALMLHGFDYSIYSSNDLKLAFTFDGSNTRFGLVSQTVFVRLPLKYQRKSYAFTEAERAVKNYTALVTPTRVCYDKFYLGFSVFDDPLF